MAIDLKDITVYIPSRGRADVDMTFSRLPKKWRKRTQIVVSTHEYKKYRKAFGKDRVMQLPVDGIGHVRQRLVERCPTKYMLMMDDDMRFATRVEGGGYKLRNCEELDMKRMLRRMMNPLEDEGYVHVGLAARTNASWFLCSYRTVVRQNNVHGFNVHKLRKLMKKYKFSFEDIELMEDFHVTLSLFERGFPNKVLFDYTWDQRASNYRGGCSEYRTFKAQKRAARRLAKLHPGHVEVKIKRAKAAQSWDGMRKRYDVQVAWRKAYKGKEDPHWEIERKSVRK